MARAGVYIAVRKRGAAAAGGTGDVPAPVPPSQPRVRRDSAWAPRPRGALPRRPEPGAAASASDASAAEAPGGAAAQPRADAGFPRSLGWSRRAWMAGGLAAAAVLLSLGLALGLLLREPVPVMTEEAFDLAVQRSLETASLPATAARAWEAIRPSVVRVRAFGPGDEDAQAGDAKPPSRPEPGRRDRPASPDGEDVAQGTGTGVVILEQGIILTNLHVVAGAKRIQVVFDDGLESEATLISVRPEHDLAVLKARTLPDDLVAATMRSSGDLMPGDRVVAVGFPFGIGPSVSAGVVSGLEREYVSEDGKRELGRLIQFDAAANPGNSGGPLVTDDGEVVGIVTGILNPVGQRFFVGIGFAVPIESAAAGFGLPPF